MDELDEALGEGWAVGVCGWQYREAHEVSDGEGGLQENTVPCDFITEFGWFHEWSERDSSLW